MEDPRLASGSHAKLGNGMESPYFVAAPGALGTDLGDITGELEEAPSHPDSPSVEDYDEVSRNPVGDGGRAPAELSLQHRTTDRNDEDVSANTSPRLVIPLDTKDLPAMQDPRGFLLAADDNELREILRRGLLKAQEPASAKKRARFAEMLFTRKFSAFDRQNGVGAASPFHGFFTLFWITVFFFMVKIAADNWRNTGNILGTNDIMKTMFRRDIFVLAVSDGVMCGLTGVSWLFQSLVFQGYFTWDRSGWILQNLWQTTYFAGVIGWTQLRDWPWSHTVFFVMHGIVMLMKQHSYAFYNGYLSSAHKKRRDLLIKLKQLEQMAPVRSPSRTEPPASAISTSHLAHPPSLADMKQRRMSNSGREQPSDLDRIAVAINSGAPLDLDQVDIFERIVKWEIDGLTEELRGKSTRLERAYPHNLTAANHYEYIFLPTVVYELEYPRSEKINWSYVAEKVAACFGVIFVMIMISQAFIYPVVMETVRMKEVGMPLADRFRAFPWMMGDLIFPFMMEYLLSWYLIWETILNIVAELTYFADRAFYDSWWNSVTWEMYARDWNRPVHNFLLRHVYHSSISAMKVDKHTATLVTFFLSACVHELVMWCIFKKLRGYLLFLQMCQLPLVKLSRTRWMRKQETLGNIIFWLGIFMGPSVLCSLYLIL